VPATWLVCAVPAILVGLMFSGLGLEGTSEANAHLQSAISGSPRAILTATVIGPCIETFILVAVVAVFSLVLRTPLLIAIAVGIAAGITHGIVNGLPAQFVGPAWTFFVMALAWQVWRTGGNGGPAFLKVWGVHFLQNSLAVALVFLDR